MRSTHFIDIGPEVTSKELLEQWQASKNKYPESSRIKDLTSDGYKTISILNKNIERWQELKIPDITIFTGVLNAICHETDIIQGYLIRTIYECMEKSVHNLGILNGYIKNITSAQINGLLGLLTLEQEHNQELFKLHHKLLPLNNTLIDIHIYPRMARLTNVLSVLNLDTEESKKYSAITNKRTIETLTNYILQPDIVTNVLYSPKVTMREVIKTKYAALLISTNTNLLPSLLHTDNNISNVRTYITLLEFIEALTKNISSTLPDSFKSRYAKLISLSEPISSEFKEHYPQYHSQYIFYKLMNLNKLGTLVEAVTSKDLNISNEPIPFTL